MRRGAGAAQVGRGTRATAAPSSGFGWAPPPPSFVVGSGGLHCAAAVSTR